MAGGDAAALLDAAAAHQLTAVTVAHAEPVN